MHGDSEPPARAKIFEIRVKRMLTKINGPMTEKEQREG